MMLLQEEGERAWIDGKDEGGKFEGREDVRGRGSEGVQALGVFVRMVEGLMGAWRGKRGRKASWC